MENSSDVFVSQKRTLKTLLVPEHENTCGAQNEIPNRRSAQSPPGPYVFQSRRKTGKWLGRFTLRPLCGRNDLSAKRVVAGISSVRTQRNTAGSLFMCDKRGLGKCRSRARPSSGFFTTQPSFTKRPLYVLGLPVNNKLLIVPPIHKVS